MKTLKFNEVENAKGLEIAITIFCFLLVIIACIIGIYNNREIVEEEPEKNYIVVPINEFSDTLFTDSVDNITLKGKLVYIYFK